MEHNITVDIYASWSDLPPQYRIYVDNDLLTERDFSWDGHKFYIKENIIVNLEPGNHVLVVEQISQHGHIRIKNVTMNGVACSNSFITNENKYSINL